MQKPDKYNDFVKLLYQQHAVSTDLASFEKKLKLLNTEIEEHISHELDVTDLKLYIIYNQTYISV